MNVILLGAPGAGKGTIAQHLSKKYLMVQVSTGDALREEVKAESALGKKVGPIMKSGALVSDELIAEVLKSKLSKVAKEHGVILDGYPRTTKQSELLDGILNAVNRKLDMVIDIETNEEVIVKRLTGRKQCKNCNRIYGVDNPSQEEGKCDACEGEVYTRPDDSEEVVRKRLETYKQNTLPLIEFYKERGKVFEIDGNKPLDNVYTQVDKLMEEKQ